MGDMYRLIEMADSFFPNNRLISPMLSSPDTSMFDYLCQTSVFQNSLLNSQGCVHTGVPKFNQNRRDRERQLNLRLTRVENRTIFRCVVRNRAIREGETLDASVTLDVNYFPRVSVGPENPLKVEVNGTVEILAVRIHINFAMAEELPDDPDYIIIEEADPSTSTSHPNQSHQQKAVQDKPAKQTSSVWQYYDKLKDKTSAKCRFCEKTIKHSGNTTNLMQHISRKHEIMMMKRKCHSDSDSSRGSSVNAPIKRKKPQLIQSNDSCIDDAFSRMKSYQEGGLTADRITLSIMYMIAVDKLPLSTVEARGFKRLMKTTTPLYKIPSRKTITQMMKARYEILKDLFRENIQKASSYTLTCDNWTDVANQSYLGVTIHYLGADYEMKNRNLGLLPLDESHTSDYLLDSLLKIVEDFDVDLNKVMAVVSDSAANIKSAVARLVGNNKRLPCFAHILSHLVPNALHPIQPAMEIITKVKKIVKLVRHSIVASDELKRLQKRDGKTDGTVLKFIQDVETRWNSTYYMLERFLVLEDYVYPVITKCNNMPDMLSRNEIAVLKDLVAVMSPIASVITEVSGETYPTCSIMIPIVHCMTAAVTNCKTTTEIGNEFQTKLLAQINAKFHGSDSNVEATRILAISTILDPRFKRLDFQSALAVSNALQDIDRQLRKISDCNTRKARENDQNVNPNKNNPKSTTSDLWNFHQILVEKNRGEVEDVDSLNLELKQYLHQPVIERSANPFSHWESLKPAFPTLSKLALQYLSVIATSVPSERLFSHAGNVKTDNRNRLTGEHLSMLLFLGSMSMEEWRLV
ncbi:E3 SUMO-protein ligase ZBED1-like [Temnothorax nylanderi]|uniref:E3 SUMO-protein ligase ZBED1-like n=1 Tax=Temnothorax nylanderi TaxID=102681 RepID=UPI003A8B30C7